MTMTSQEVIELGRIIVFSSVIIIVALAVGIDLVIAQINKKKLYKHLFIKN